MKQLNIDELALLDNQHYMDTFGKRLPVAFSSGKGCTLTGLDGKTYTDFLAGIATNALGYADQGFLDVLSDQAAKLVHCSNYFYNQPQAQLAELLCKLTCADKVFFASTGAEANETAIKLARKYFYEKKADRYKIISAKNSFHGRTLATVTATGQEKYQTPFAPLPEGFLHVTFGDLDSLKSAIDEHTAAIMLEVIQGEGGVLPCDSEYLKSVREICDQNGILLIFDEVQTGMGRTGELFAHQLYGVEPDIFTSAKALGNGLPISACLSKEEFSAFTLGSHGTTFGGNPLCCAVALYTLQRISDPDFLAYVKQTGEYFKGQLTTIANKFPNIVEEVRGFGLLLGMQLKPEFEAPKIMAELIEKGFIIGTAGQNTLRFVPPLIIQAHHIDSLIAAINEVFNSKTEV